MYIVSILESFLGPTDKDITIKCKFMNYSRSEGVIQINYRHPLGGQSTWSYHGSETCSMVLVTVARRWRRGCPHTCVSWLWASAAINADAQWLCALVDSRVIYVYICFLCVCVRHVYRYGIHVCYFGVIWYISKFQFNMDIVFLFHSFF